MYRLLLQLIPAALSHALFCAHLLFHGFGWLSFLPLAAAALLACPRRAALLIQTALLTLWTAEWIRSGALLVMARLSEGRSPVLSGIIMTGVALFTLLSMLCLWLRTSKAHFR